MVKASQHAFQSPGQALKDVKAEFTDANDLMTASIASIEIALQSMTFERASMIKKSMKVVKGHPF
jgi:hypothetical protein